MGKYDFDKVQDRTGTGSIKWDYGMKLKGRDDLLPMWVADMDFKLPQEVIEDIKTRADHGIFGYTDLGESYYGPLKKWLLGRHGFEPLSEWISVVPGVVYSIACAIRAVTEPGDAVIIQKPVYYPFERTIKQNGRKVVNNQLIYKDGHYEIDFEDFEKKIVENEVKLFILCSPHNPVGRVWTRDELYRLAEICHRHEVYVFADEIHCDFVYEGHKHVPFITLDEKFNERLMLGMSASKTFNLAGLQVANVIIPNEELRSAFRKENDKNGYDEPNVLGMTATASAYTHGEEWLTELIAYLKGNVDYVRDFLKEELPKVKLIEPEGTYLIWLDFSEVTQDHKVLEDIIVDKAKLWLDPGMIFDKDSALFERINIACPRQTVRQAMEQLKEALEK